MFWKKKKKIDLETDDLLSDHRTAFRISPDRSKSVIVTILGHAFHALNISGTGVCFRSYNFPEGTVVAATIRLPSEDRIFPVTLEVVSKQRDLCRCHFREIHPDSEDFLYAYILELQKAKIRHNQSH